MILKKIIIYTSALLLLFSILLTIINLYGLFFPVDFRKHPTFEKIYNSKDNQELRAFHDFNQTTKSYEETIKSIDNLYEIYGNSSEFIRNSTLAYFKGVIYGMPKEISWVRIHDNWILFFLGAYEFLQKKFEVKNPYNQFLVFESNNYVRALRRGFGICSQHSLGFTDLLEKRYGIFSNIIGLSGHVIMQVNLGNKKIIADPSTGLYFDFDIQSIERDEFLLEKIYLEYKKIGFENAGKSFDSKGNVFYEEFGSKSFSSNKWK